MKYILISLLLLISSVVSAQDSTKVNFYSSSLNIGEMLEFGNRSLKFKNVISDSRCPENVTCIWAGEAIVAVEIFENGECIREETISIQSSNIPLEFSVGNVNYSIRGVSLRPHPSVKRSDLPKNYILHMSVKETLEI